MTRPIPTLFALSFALVIAGCGLIDEFSPADDCIPGRVQYCPCAGGAIGAQACNADGESYGVCTCPGDDGFDEFADEVEDFGEGYSDDSGAFGGAPDSDAPADPSPGGADEGFDVGTVDTTPDPEPLPDPDVALNDARIHVLVVGGSLSVSVRGDWSVTGRDDVTVDFEVLSNVTYRQWTALATGLPPVYFADMNMPAAQGESRFDFRVVARDANGGSWTSNTITIQ